MDVGCDDFTMYVNQAIMLVHLELSPVYQTFLSKVGKKYKLKKKH